jgi:hypothetical protein
MSSSYLERVFDKRFDPDQPRDEQGRWSETAGGGGWEWGDDEARFSLQPPADVVDQGVKLADGEWAQAAQRYTTGGYKRINGALRSGEQMDRDDAADAEKLRSLMRDHEPQTTWRGLRIGPGARWGAPTDEETYNRVADWAEENFQPGDEVELGGFQSTSYGIQPALDAALGKDDPGVIFEIRSNRGVYLGNVTEWDDEDELLLPDDSRFRVGKVLREVQFEDVLEDKSVTRTVVQLEQI